jgi:hypothetical protein
VFENEAINRKFGPKRQEVTTGGCRKLYIEALHNLNSSNIRAIKSRSVRLARNMTCMREMRIAYKSFVGKPEAKRPLGRLTGR